MFKKTEKQNYIKLSSKMSELPDNIDKDQKELAEKTLELVTLVSEKYSLYNIKARLNKLDPNNISIIFFNGRHGVDSPKIDKENVSAIEYLQLFEVQVEKESCQYSYWSNSVVTLEASKVDSILEGLKLLADPDPDENPRERLVAKC